jgi:hypothetical protein
MWAAQEADAAQVSDRKHWQAFRQTNMLSLLAVHAAAAMVRRYQAQAAISA